MRLFSYCRCQGISANAWLLAVPKHQFKTGQVVEKSDDVMLAMSHAQPIPVLSTPMTIFDHQQKPKGLSQNLRFFKSSNWASSENGWNRWIDRDLEMSVRLLHLLKLIGAKGFNEVTCNTPTLPDASDELWIQNQVDTAQGCASHQMLIQLLLLMIWNGCKEYIQATLVMISHRSTSMP